MERLAGRVALITGAGRGIGAATAKLLSDQGVKLALASRRGENPGVEGALVKETDVRDPKSVQAMVDAAIQRFGKLDIVIGNAGVGGYGPFLDTPDQWIEDMIDTNVKGLIYTLRAALPHLIKSDAADVVTVASEAGRRGLPFEAVYCSSKFAQVGLTAALDHELRPLGIRATNVCPGGVSTDFAMGTGRTPDMPELKGMMHPEDVAETILFVLTRPRNQRILEVAFRPVTEQSWG
ncbi:MAG TPA: SDR family oxidoreductase [Candidatus Limnocylindrales bacterium]|jgi:3-oxoacyl-[acyl-carrier protein] reductase